MDEGQSNSADPRAVVLSRDEGFCRSPRLRCVRADSAYEAAAELLAGPCLALVIDLRAMSVRHLRLLEVARKLGLEVLACGPLGPVMDSDQLAGVRLVARPELAAELERLAEAEAPPEEDAAAMPEQAAGGPMPMSQAAPVQGQPSAPRESLAQDRTSGQAAPQAVEQAADSIEPPLPLSPSDRLSVERPEAPPAPEPGLGAAQRSDAPPEPARLTPAKLPSPPTAEPSPPGQVLTREELAALLEDQA
jgi:hypothetical protein